MTAFYIGQHEIDDEGAAKGRAISSCQRWRCIPRKSRRSNWFHFLGIDREFLVVRKSLVVEVRDTSVKVTWRHMSGLASEKARHPG